MSWIRGEFHAQTSMAHCLHIFRPAQWFRSEKRPGQAVLEFTVGQNHFEDSAVLPLLESR